MKSTTSSTFRFLFIAMLISTLLSSAVTVTPARAASITVNSNADTVANDGVCTLREAITAANTDTASGIATGECPAGSAGADTISFAGNYTITLGGTQLPVVTTQITINGNGTTNTDIRANASPNVAASRVFEVDATGNLTLSDLTVQNGRCAATCATYPNNGGGIANAGTLTITFSRLESNSVTQDGGGIFNAGTLTVTNSTFVSNTSSNNGGGIYNNDTLTVTNSTFNTNTAGDSGGGIFNGGFAMSITNSQFTQNSSSSGGGSIYNSSNNMDTVSITSSTFNNNSSNAGGGIYNVVGNLSISASSFSGNSASTTLSGGGGIYNGYGMTITNSTISSNQSLADNGGGITNDGTLTITGSTIFNNQAFYNGGGIYNGTGSTLFLENSFISNNSAANTSGGGGGIMNGGGTMNVTNSTFSGNSSTDDGAGIYNNNGTATVTNSTISGNSANSNGGGIYVGTGNFNLRNTIIANSVNGGDCAGSFASTSNNLIENASSACGLINGVNGNIIGSDPNLGSPTGSPEYLPLNAGSPAIDAGDNAICAAAPVSNQSQNGVTRPFGTSCDIGSFELLNASPTTLVNSVLPTSRTPMVGNPVTIFNTVLNAGAETAYGVSLSMNPAPAGSFSYTQTNCASNAVIGSPNAPVDIPAGGLACYVLSFTPSAAFSATQVHIQAQASNASATSLLPGINTWLLRATTSAGPDVIALTTTTDFHQVACSGLNAFAVALSNVGAAASGDITVSANTGSASLPISVSIQETNPGTGAIIGDNILNNLGAGENRTVAVFVTFNGCVNFDPAANRIFIEFRDASNNVVGSTSTAVSTNR